MQVLDEETLSILRCPVTRSKLKLENGFLVGEIGGLRYPVAQRHSRSPRRGSDPASGD